MNYYILISKIKVQNANAVAGFTWGFPAITHFLGFTHNLSRSLSGTEFQNVGINGCSVIVHEHCLHTYKNRFTQSKNPAFLSRDVDKVSKGGAPSIVEEGKMNMTISLVLGLEGFLGRDSDDFILWLRNKCLSQRLAGGSILSIDDIQLYDSGSQQDFFKLKRLLMPGFALMDRSLYLSEYYDACLDKGDETDHLEAWLDFAALKQQARPASDLINRHLNKIFETAPALLETWNKHLGEPYSQKIPGELKSYFSQLNESKSTRALLKQWDEYINPTNKTKASWEYISKPRLGYLVPIMTGYKAISPIYENDEIDNTRDSETPVRFVESVHSVGEWRGINRFNSNDDVAKSLWHYSYDGEWYLCQQKEVVEEIDTDLEQQIEALFDPIDELI